MEQHRLSMKAIFHAQGVSIWLPTGQAKVFTAKTFLMDFKRNCMVTGHRRIEQASN